MQRQGRATLPWLLSVPRGPAFTSRSCQTLGLATNHMRTTMYYREKRMVCFGMLRDRMVVVGYTPRGADRHVLSKRKANDRGQARITSLLGI